MLAALLCVLTGCGEDEKSSTISERWEEIYMDGIKAGYSHTKATRAGMEEGREVWQVTTVAKFVVVRDGKRAELGVRYSSVETPEGRCLRFETVSELGGQPTTVNGRVEGDRLLVERKTGSESPKSDTLPWSTDHLSEFAAQRALERQPMAPGESRKVRCFDPLLLKPLVVQFTAEKHERTALRDGEAELMRIRRTAVAEGAGEINGVIWTDQEGRIVKAWNPDQRETTYLSSRFEAVKEPEGKLYDIGLATRVPVNRPLKDAHATKRVVYKVTLKDRDPATVFATGPTQTLESIDGRTAKLIVRALRPDTPGISELRPPEANLRPNSLIQSDDETVRAMARQTAADENDPWKIAVVLERKVRESVRPAEQAQALVSAAEVARSLQGDCTEHAVLLAALARARGIPARAALGLVYSNGYFAFHMWTEVYVAHRWVPLDATLGMGGIGGAHLKLADTNFAAEEGMSSFWRVATAMGQIEKLDIVEVEP
jgi:hypothetical protein